MTSDGALSTLLLLLAERHLDAVRCWPEAAGGGARGAFLVTHAVVRGEVCGGGGAPSGCGPLLAGGSRWGCKRRIPGHTCSGEGGGVWEEVWKDRLHAHA